MSKTSPHEPELRAYLEALPKPSREADICLLIGFLAARLAIECGHQSAAGLLYVLADHAVTGPSAGPVQ